MTKAIKIRCHHCRKVFHLPVFPNKDVDDSGIVRKLARCPYCDTDCAVEIPPDSKGVTVLRQGPVGGTPPESIPGLANSDEPVFESHPPEGGTEKD